MKRLWENYNLSIVLCALFLLSWGIQTVSGWFDFVGDQRALGQTPQMGDYMWHWLAATFENWQSEFLQLLSFVILTSFLIHKGSHESKDTDDEVQRQLNRMERKIDRLEAGVRK